MKSLWRQTFPPAVKTRGDAGFGLLEAIVAVGVTAVAVVAISSSLNFSFKGNAATSKRSDLNAVKQSILQTFDCNKSLGSPAPAALPLNCASYTNIPLKTKAGVTMNGGGKIGIFPVSASCQGNHVVFKVTANGTLTNDPLTGRSLTTNDLFNGTSLLCQNYFTAAGPAPLCTPPQVITNVDFGTQTVTCGLAGTGSFGCSAPNIITAVNWTSQTVTCGSPPPPVVGPGPWTCTPPQIITSIDLVGQHVNCGYVTPRLTQVSQSLPLIGSNSCWLSYAGTIAGKTYPNYGDSYGGQVYCPNTNWIATGGGVSCQTGYGAEVVTNGPIAGTNGWQGKCCVPHGTGGGSNTTIGISCLSFGP